MRLSELQKDWGNHFYNQSVSARFFPQFVVEAGGRSISDDCVSKNAVK